jgi:hypothetical protein
MKAKLLKRMTVNGTLHDAGQVIEVGGWKNIKTLISNRYIEVILEEEKPKVLPKAKTEVKEAPEIKEIALS